MSFYQDYSFTATGLALTANTDFTNAVVGTQFTKSTGEIFEKTASGIYKKAGVAGTGGAGGDPVSGFFPSGLNVTERYSPTDLLVNSAYTYGGTGRCIVTGIYAANVSDLAGVTISAWAYDSSLTTDYSLAYEMPIPVGSSINLLKKPKVLEPSDIIKLQTDSPSYVEFTIVAVDLDTATEHYFLGQSLSTVNSTTLATGSANGDVLASILISNDDIEPIDDNDAVQVSAWWDNGVDATRLLYSGDIYPGQSLEILDAPILLANTHTIKIQADKANCADAIVAGFAKTA